MISLLKKASLFFLILTTSLPLVQFCFAQQNIAPLTQLITDYSKVLSPEALSGLEQQALRIETNTTAQIAAVLFPHRNGEELYDIGVRLFRESGIGQQDKNNGMLLLIATEEKKLRIMVGYGLEGVFPDIWASTLIESQLRPAVTDGNRQQAIQLYLHAVQERLSQEANLPIETEAYAFSGRDIACFFIRLCTTIASFKAIHKKTKNSLQQISPLAPFLGIFILAFLALPGVIGAFFGYIGGIIGGLILYPHPSSHGSGGFSYWGGSGGSFGGSFGGGFGGFSGGSTGGGGAGD